MHVYLDHAATTPARPEVATALQPYNTDSTLMGNPSSLHALGRKAADTLSKCHDVVAEMFDCQHDDVVFNSGGSEGDTHALFGTALLIGKPVHVAVSAIEHKAVLHAADRLAELGHRATVLPVTGSGVVALECIEELIANDRPDLVSVMAVNNEVGTVQPLADIARICLSHGVLLHTDAVQAVGHDIHNILCNQEIPLLTISGHKFGASRGTGILIQRRGLIQEVLDRCGNVSLPALICGGQQEHGCRAGTENVAGAVGLVTALRLAENPNQAEAQRMQKLRQCLEDQLRELIPDCVIHGEEVERAPHITSVALPGFLGRDVLKKLDRKGVCIGLGSACTGCETKVSHVLDAMQVSPGLAEATLRFSLGWSTTEDEIEVTMDMLANILR